MKFWYTYSIAGLIFLNLLYLAITGMLLDRVMARDLYVDAKFGDDSYTGLDWSEAKKTIYGAVNTAVTGDAIHVAEGEYRESVFMKDGILLFGGYPNGGGVRDFNLHKSIIDALFPIPSQSAVTMGNETTIDGFTIRHGTGHQTTIFSELGGGIYCSDVTVVIKNNIIADNVINSVEGAYGGGIYLLNAHGEIFNNIIKSNRINGLGDGSAIYIWNSTVQIYNNFVYRNESFDGSKGSICLRNSNGDIYNNTILENEGVTEGGINLANSSPSIYNNILMLNSGYAIREADASSDPLCSFNNINENMAGVYLDEGTRPYFDIASFNSSVPEASDNIGCDPIFKISDDFHLRSISCCIDAGTSLGAPSTDLDGDLRPLMSGIDIGCDEVKPFQVSQCNSITFLFFQLLFISCYFYYTLPET